MTYQECRVLIDGHIDKTLAVHGERVWVEHGGSVTLSKPVPFIERISITPAQLVVIYVTELAVVWRIRTKIA